MKILIRHLINRAPVIGRPWTICISRQAGRNNASTRGVPPLHMSDGSSLLSPVTNVPVSRCRPANVRRRSACLRIRVMNIHVFRSNRQLVSPYLPRRNFHLALWHSPFDFAKIPLEIEFSRTEVRHTTVLPGWLYFFRLILVGTFTVTHVLHEESNRFDVVIALTFIRFSVL